MQQSDTIQFLLSRVEQEHNTVLTGKNFSLDFEGNNIIPSHFTVRQCNLKNGDMLFIMVDESKTGVHEMAHSSAKRISKSGDIVSQDYLSISQQTGFRPGMMPLRSIKKHWTLSEFVSLDEQFVFRLKAVTPPRCKLVNVDTPAVEDFFGYARAFDFQRMR